MYEQKKTNYDNVTNVVVVVFKKKYYCTKITLSTQENFNIPCIFLRKYRVFTITDESIVYFLNMKRVL